MKKNNTVRALLIGLFPLIASTFLIAGVVPTYQHQSPPARQKTVADDTRWPVADYEAPQIVSPLERALRQARNNRYDRQSSQVIKETPHAVERIWSTYWWKDLPALPVKQSNAILIGDVIDAQAYLSTDKTGVYSEFSITPKEFLKGQSTVSKFPISAERFGGVVRFPSGVIHKYGTHGQGMPQIGRRYLFFLKSLDEDDAFSLLTAYELRGEKIIPLDGGKGKGTEQFPFDSYRDADVSSFLKLVHDSISLAGGVQGNDI